MDQTALSILGWLILVVVVVLCIFGYIANIVLLIGIADGPITGMLVLRGIGVFVAPLGVILGFL